MIGNKGTSSKQKHDKYLLNMKGENKKKGKKCFRVLPCFYFTFTCSLAVLYVRFTFYALLLLFLLAFNFTSTSTHFDFCFL